jgi:hypothetical protein
MNAFIIEILLLAIFQAFKYILHSHINDFHHISISLMFSNTIFFFFLKIAINSVIFLNISKRIGHYGEKNMWSEDNCLKKNSFLSPTWVCIEACNF